MADRLAVVGSRDYPNEEEVRAYIRKQPPGTKIISGGAEGVDSWAVDEAKKLGLPYKEFLPLREIFGSQAPWFRNHDIINNADRVVAFIYAASKGSNHAVELAEKRQLQIEYRILHG